MELMRGVKIEWHLRDYPKRWSWGEAWVGSHPDVGLLRVSLVLTVICIKDKF